MYLPLLSALGDAGGKLKPTDTGSVSTELDLSPGSAGGDAFAAMLATLEGVETALGDIGAEQAADGQGAVLQILREHFPSLSEEALTDLEAGLRDLAQALSELTPGESMPAPLQQHISDLVVRIDEWLEQAPEPELAALQESLQSLSELVAEHPDQNQNTPRLDQALDPLAALLASILGAAGAAETGGKALPQSANSGGVERAAGGNLELSPVLAAVRKELNATGTELAGQSAGSGRDASTARGDAREDMLALRLRTGNGGEFAKPEVEAEAEFEQLFTLPDGGPRRGSLAAPLLQTPGHAPVTTPAAAATPVAGSQAVPAAQGTTPLLNQLPVINHSPGESAWSQALGERVLWMTGRDMQQAEVRLNPPQLGPVEIRVSMHNDQANVTFVAQHPFTREALEASIPRLREMFGESNINLADVDVGQRDARDSGSRQAEPEGTQAGDGLWMSADTAPDEHSVVMTRSRSGLVDDFA